MQFYSLQGEIKQLAGKKVSAFFERAVKGDQHVTVHREYVRDILRIFADKTNLTFAQVCQLTRGESFSPYAQRMHRKLAAATPKEIRHPQTRELIPNPLYVHLQELSDLPSEGHNEFMRQGWLWATTLIHPHSEPLSRSASEPDKVREAANIRKNMKHPDETYNAHRERTRLALAAFLNDPNNLQKAGDILIERILTERAERMFPSEEELRIR